MNKIFERFCGALKVAFFLLSVCAASLFFDARLAGAKNVYKDENGIRYRLDPNEGTCEAISCGKDCSGYVKIPESFMGYRVASIADGAFFGQDGIKGAVIGVYVEKIGERAFSCCSNLRSVEFAGNDLRKISRDAFALCSSLRRIELPDGLEKIGACAFSFCPKLYQAVIPESAKRISASAFFGCRTGRMTIVAKKGSAAHKYAVDGGYPTSETPQMGISSKKTADIPGARERIFVCNAPLAAKWKSLDKTTAKVDSHGNITFLRPGRTLIAASVCGEKFCCEVRVLKRSRRNCLRTIYSKYVKKDMSDYEKAYNAHAWLIKNVKYDKRLYTKGRVPRISHTQKGAFAKGVAVCDGYSRAFMQIIGHYEIPCIMVAGGGHAWNMVKIKNRWYHVDCTFDDPVVNGKYNNKYVFLDFFLKTDGKMRPSHVWERDKYPKCRHKKINKEYRTQYF